MVSDYEIEAVKKEFGDNSNINTIVDVAKGKRWFVTDAISAAASYFLHRVSELSKETNRLTRENKELTTVANKVDKEAELGRKTIKDSLASVAEAKKCVEAITKDRDSYAKRNREFTVQVKGLSEERDGLAAEIEGVRNDFLRATRDADETKEALKSAHGRIAQYESRASRAESALKNMEERLQVAEKALHVYADNKNKLLDLINNLRVTVEEMGT